MVKLIKSGILALCLLPIVFAVQAIGENFKNKISTDTLGGAERFLAYVSTDKPIYRQSEPLYLRTVILNAADNTPIPHGHVPISFEVKGPNGNLVHQGRAFGQDSVAGAHWQLPPDIAGGVYTIVVSSPQLGIPETTRDIEIRAFRAPRLNTQIEFIRDGYGPGDRVQVSAMAKRVEGGVPEGARVSVIARVDGVEVFQANDLSIQEDGTVYTEFDLPTEIDRGEGQVAFVISDGGVRETVSKTLPILLQNLDVSFYPESGDLVAGLNSRVYFQIRRPDGKPADIEGEIVELRDGQSVGTVLDGVATSHEGRGILSFQPTRNTQYALAVTRPSGIDTLFKLPAVKNRGTVLTAAKPVFENNESISIAVESIGKHPASSITLHKRERLLDTQVINGNQVTLDGGDAGDGVLIVTAWDKNGLPLAERLIYREARFRVNVDIELDRESFTPGSTATLGLSTTDENGKPVEAIVGLTVTDDVTLQMKDKRDRAPRLPVMVYLEGEVQDLADADVYLDPTDKRAADTVDMLLGTQGWRRFILVRYDQVKSLDEKAAQRVLAERRMIAQPMVMMRNDNRDVFARNPQVLRQVMEKAFVEDEGAGMKAEAGAQIMPEIQADLAADVMHEDMDIAAPRAPAARKRMAGFRQYAFQARPGKPANERTDFTSTVFWHVGVRTGARNGKAQVKFDLSDSITTYRIQADAFTRNGSVGSSDELIQSVEPFYLEPKMPLQVTVGDEIALPVSLINASDVSFRHLKLSVGSDVATLAEVTVPGKLKSLDAGERSRQVVRLLAKRPGQLTLTFSGTAGNYSDQVVRTLTIVPAGFPVSVNHGGLLAADSPFDTNIHLPEDIEPGSLSAVAKVYPSPLASMQEALNALLRQPNGCFEQASSTNYPLVMAQQYFQSHQGIDPAVIQRAKGLLKTGYDKLIGFESSGNGYEWFGASPAHEALTAYGLMEFVDMAKVMNIDADMINRTRQWLISRRDGEGGFKRNEKALDSFGAAPAPTTNAYIVWALLESGQDPATLKSEIEAVRLEAAKGHDTYVVALAANILHLADQRKAAMAMSKLLSARTDADGSVSGAKTSITRSGGDALVIETTSLAVLAWLRDDEQFAAATENAMKWLFERSKSGRFGSTQSTVLALKAINAYDEKRSVPKQPGSVQLLINGKAIGEPVAFDQETKGAIALPDFADALQPGELKIELVMNDGSKMPFALDINYHSTLPVSSQDTPLFLETRLSELEVKEGEPVDITAVVRAGSEVVASPLAIIGLPAGLEVRHERLKELVDADQISAYEIAGQDLILYWRGFKAQEERVLRLQFTAAIPGMFQAPASRVYAYYTDEDKRWQPGHQIVIRP